MKRKLSFDGSDRRERETDVSRRDVLRTGATGLAVTVGVVGFSTPVAAEQGAVFDFFDDDESSSFTKAYNALKGKASRYFADEDKRTAKESAKETVDVFNANADVVVEYANEQLSDDRDKTSLDSIRVVFEKTSTVDRWIVADVDQDANKFLSAEMTNSKPESVDHYIKLTGLAVADAPDELEFFVDEYAEDGEPIDDAYEGRVAGKYGEDVDTSLME